MTFFTILGFALMMGFYGSWHCGAMCGPVTMNFKAKNDFLIYQLARLAAYVVLTTLIFYFSQWFLKSDFIFVRIVTSLSMGLILIYMGYVNYKNGKPTPDFLSHFLKLIPFKKQKIIFSSPLLMGLFTGLLPCGWLYSFVLLTPQLKNIWQAIALIFVFWLTAIPALATFRGVMLKMIQQSPVNYQKISSVVLVIAGLLSIVGQWSSLIYLNL
jgi:sulfite exporter TauE/SafE